MARRIWRPQSDCLTHAGPTQNCPRKEKYRLFPVHPAELRQSMSLVPFVFVRGSVSPVSVGSQQPVSERWYSEKRLTGLSRFAVAITLLNIIGHAFLGFEQPWITPFVALGASYATDLIGETVDAWGSG